ncbi:MAG: L(+)-tartrate dehydratase subunit beta [Fusobacteriaceae bacterium]|jgi:L(+)-tartrate dehydratase beta subunit|nr:L(+)-tartrate dehydratase subunit beta [Fusobacteriaceae bacterium]
MKKILKTPLTTEDIKDLRTGDIIYLTGELGTGRDDVHHRVVREGMTSPYDFRGGAIMHAGPIIKEENGKNTLINIGPTSSIRMEADAADFIRLTGVKIQIGKGGMEEKTAAACKKYGAIHCVYPGGCAVSAAARVREIKDVFWRELGMPECLWVLKVEEFGPLIVSIDTEGNNLFAENKKYYAARKEECMAPILESVKDYMKVE